MCFGMQVSQQQNQTQGQVQSGASTSNQTPAWLQNAAQGNIMYLQNLQANGFNPYTGNQVAGFSPQQQQSFNLAGDLAYNTLNGPLGTLAENAATAGRYTVSPSAISANPITASSVNADSIASQMSPYMSQYVQQALAPQLKAYDLDTENAMKAVNSQATASGAFGDDRAALQSSTTDFLRNLGRQGLVANAYNTAFNTAIGAGAQDVANRLAAGTTSANLAQGAAQFNAGQGLTAEQINAANSLAAGSTNANLYETALQRQLGGANQLYGLGSGAVNLLNTAGGQQTAQSQAQLNALYNQWLMAQQYPFMTSQALGNAVTQAGGVAPKTTTGTSTSNTQGTTTTEAPNNVGYQLAGSLIGAGGAALSGGGTGAMLNYFGGMGGGGYYGGSPGAQWMAAGQGQGPWAAAAKGGKVNQTNKPIIVGEKGPELFVPKSKGTVIPNHELRNLTNKYAKKSPQKAQFFAGGPVVPGTSGTTAPTRMAMPMPSTALPAVPTAAMPNGMRLPMPAMRQPAMPAAGLRM